MDETGYLFRGTTVGFAGSVYPRVGLTSASVDPVVAVLFATTAGRRGAPVVYVIPTARFAGRFRDNRGSHGLAALEGKFVIEASPEEVAAASVGVDVATARAILGQLGVVFPAAIYNLADFNDALRLTRRLSQDEIARFVRTVEGLRP